MSDERSQSISSAIIKALESIKLAAARTEVYAQRGLSPAAASEMGKLGAAASSASQPKSGHMPLREIVAIMNDHSLTVHQAAAKIRRDRRYKVKVSLPTIYRWNRDGKIKLRPRPSGKKSSA